MRRTRNPAPGKPRGRERRRAPRPTPPKSRGEPPKPAAEPRKRQRMKAAQVQEARAPRRLPIPGEHSNNTDLTITDPGGETSAGPRPDIRRVTRGLRKSTPFAAQKAAEAMRGEGAKFALRGARGEDQAPRRARRHSGPSGSGSTSAPSRTSPRCRTTVPARKRGVSVAESSGRKCRICRASGSSSSSRAPGATSAKCPHEKEARPPRPARRQARPDDDYGIHFRESSAPSGCTACSSASSPAITARPRSSPAHGRPLVQALERRLDTWVCTPALLAVARPRAPAHPARPLPRHGKKVTIRRRSSTRDLPSRREAGEEPEAGEGFVRDSQGLELPSCSGDRGAGPPGALVQLPAVRELQVPLSRN